LPPRLPRLYPGIGALHFPLGSNFVVNDISGHVLLESFAVPCVERINELASNSNEILFGHAIPPLGLGQDVWAPGRDEYTPGSLPRGSSGVFRPKSFWQSSGFCCRSPAAASSSRCNPPRNGEVQPG